MDTYGKIDHKNVTDPKFPQEDLRKNPNISMTLVDRGNSAKGVFCINLKEKENNIPLDVINKIQQRFENYKIKNKGMFIRISFKVEVLNDGDKMLNDILQFVLNEYRDTGLLNDDQYLSFIYDNKRYYKGFDKLKNFIY